MTDEEFEQQNEYEDSLQERIKELEKENEKLKRNLQYAYDDFNEIQQELDNLGSDHNLLIDDKQRVIEDMQKQIKFQSDARKRVLKQLEIYKKALELACERIGKEHCIFDPKCVQNFEKNIYINKFLQQAKESLKCKE